MLAQPHAGIIPIPSKEAALPPIGTPDIISVDTSDRLCCGTNSAASAFADGTRPPSPSPARKRNTPNEPGFHATAHSTVNTENQAVHSNTVRRLPMRSDRAPAARAPTSIPAKARLPSSPARPGVRCHPGSRSSSGSTVP
jgi:hypothetical protein